jgi:hypothetical protein
MSKSSTMFPGQLPSGTEWKLGPELQEDHALVVLTEPAAKLDLSTARLTRAIQVLTVEHLAWAGLVIYAVLSRLLELGMAPLASYEARHALFEYDLVNGTNWASEAGYHPVGTGWVHLLEAGLFAGIGANDVTARLIFVLAGLSMIAILVLMRTQLGRAGTIAAASLITISPTFTYFSRTSAIASVAAALAMVTIQLFLLFMPRPSWMSALGLGCFSGLLCTAGPTGLATCGTLLAALALLGLYQLIVTDRAYLNLRIWLERYAAALVVVIVTAGLFWLGSQIGLSRVWEIASSSKKVWKDFGPREYFAGLEYYFPELVLYEFLISLTAITGLIAIVSLRVWSRLALFSLLWLVISSGYFLASQQRESERLVVMLLPLVFLGALGTDYLHHTASWPYARLILLALGTVTVYVQLEANFIYPAPAATEAPWARHANLYWRDSATAIEARTELGKIRKRFPEAGGTVFNWDKWQPSLRWYLRDFRQTNLAKDADLVINPGPSASASLDSDLESVAIVEIAESWDPTLSTITPWQAIRFVFTATPWKSLRNETVTILVRPPTDLAPTLIIPPGH